MTKLIVAFRSFENAPTNPWNYVAAFDFKVEMEAARRLEVLLPICEEKNT